MKATFFTFKILLFFSIFITLLSFINLYPLKVFVAKGVSFLLTLFGVPHVLIFSSPEPSIFVDNVEAQIKDLCVGHMEIALICSIILACDDRSVKSRVLGAFCSIPFVFFLNPLRISVVLFFGHYFSWPFADFIHDVLFRLTLFIVILIYFLIWYVLSWKFKL